MGVENPRRPEQPEEQEPLKPLFKLGRLAITPGAIDSLRVSDMEPIAFLIRHVTGDWGDIPEEDVKTNEYSLEHGFRLFSRYTLPTDQAVYVITEWDRSITTILLPDEY